MSNESDVHVSVLLGSRAADTVVMVDGRRLERVERVALLSDTVGDTPPRLTVHRGRPSEPSVGLGPGTITDTFDAGPGVDVELQGIVKLIEEHALESIDRACDPSTPLNALHTFMIQTDAEGAATTLGDIITAAERYRAIRTQLAGPYGGRVAVMSFSKDDPHPIGNAAALDTLADGLRALAEVPDFHAAGLPLARLIRDARLFRALRQWCNTRGVIWLEGAATTVHVTSGGSLEKYAATIADDMDAGGEAAALESRP